MLYQIDLFIGIYLLSNIYASNLFIGKWYDCILIYALSIQLHFREDHFLCEDEACLAKKFVVFLSKAQLKASWYMLLVC